MGKRVALNRDFLFSETPEKYYFFGFLLGDGSLYHDRKNIVLEVSLHPKDKSILQKFCKMLGYPTSRIRSGSGKKDGKSYPYVRLKIANKLWKEDWSKFGLVPNKTYNPINPKIPKKFLQPFLIGLIDADGTVRYKHRRKYKNRILTESYFRIVGHPKCMNWFRNQLRLLGMKKSSYERYDKEGWWKRIHFFTENGIKELGEVLSITKYKHLCLRRKWKNLLG